MESNNNRPSKKLKEMTTTIKNYSWATFPLVLLRIAWARSLDSSARLPILNFPDKTGKLEVSVSLSLLPIKRLKQP